VSERADRFGEPSAVALARRRASCEVGGMSECIHVVIQYCNDPKPARAAEYDDCVRRNLANPYVKKVHNLVEPHTAVPEEFKADPKYVQSALPHWLRYSDVFAYANQHLAGEVVCACNLDIALDADNTNWDDAAAAVRGNIVLCLGRLELADDGTIFQDPALSLFASANSQDAWVFLAPFDVPDSDFEIGTMGCDNAIAHRIKQAGRIPINAGSQFRILHYDRTRGQVVSQRSPAQSARTFAACPAPHAERAGQFLLPDINRLKSVDAILNTLKLNDLQRYTVICEVLNRLVTVRNR
jgi:hypothetical protein